MLLFEWEFSGISMGGDFQLEMLFETTDKSVLATASTRGVLLEPDEDIEEENTRVWTPIWLVLLDGASGQLLGYEDLPGLENVPGVLSMTAENLCGYRIERSMPVMLVRDPAFEP